MQVKTDEVTTTVSIPSEVSEWQDRFKVVYDRAVEAYESGEREAEGIISREDHSFLASIGAKPQELFDFVEDWCNDDEPPFDTVLAITAVRREYFLSEQQGQVSWHEISSGSLPSRWANLGGIRWLPRIIAKARAKLRGELPPNIMYGCGGDRPFLRKIGIHPADFLRLVWEGADDDQKILERVKQASSRPAG